MAVPAKGLPVISTHRLLIILVMNNMINCHHRADPVFVLLLLIQYDIIPLKGGGHMAQKSANVVARIEPSVKEQAEAILAEMGISASLGINLQR